MPYGPQKLILINSGRYDFAEVELSGSLQIVGPNNAGKTTLINSLQFLYLDSMGQMDFGAYTAEQTRNYYFPNQYSYVLFECLGARGHFVFGWRGQSKAAGGEPERFHFEGLFQQTDFFASDGSVMEPKQVLSKLSLRQFTSVKPGGEHRDFLMLATKGEARGTGLVSLRDNDRYPQFRETLKNLLSLSKITQEQMRGRLLMLAGLAPDKTAVNVRELFGEDYDKLKEQKNKLKRFKSHRSLVEAFLDACSRRDRIRGELVHRWSDLRPKRIAFEAAHQVKVEAIKSQGASAKEKALLLAGEIKDRRTQKDAISERKGAIGAKLNELAAKESDFEKSGFIEELVRAAYRNISVEVDTLKQRLANSGSQSRDSVEKQVSIQRGFVEQKTKTIIYFDRALITVLRKEFTDAEIAPLARLFNFDILEKPVGDDGIRLKQEREFFENIRALAAEIKDDVYRGRTADIPLPVSQKTLSGLADVESVRAQLAEHQNNLDRARATLRAIDEREKLITELREAEKTQENLNRQIFAWEGFQKERANQPELQKQLNKIEKALATSEAEINKLTEDLEAATQAQTSADDEKRAEENAFNAVIGRFDQCIFPEWAKPVIPDDAIPEDFDPSIALFLRQQKAVESLVTKARDSLQVVERELGSDYSGSDENETLRALREELEALEQKEQTLTKSWSHLITGLKGTFDEVMKSLNDIDSAAIALNRRLSTVQVSNLTTLRMDVKLHDDRVGPIRRLINCDQPGLFDDSASMEMAVDAFRKKFDANPLLRYADLFTLEFTVTADDGKPHRYHDLDQIESDGTTIAIKVLFNLLVLRSLLREDSSKATICEVPFFLDEIHSLDPANRRAIIQTSRKLGFIAITAAPESISEVNALYYLTPKKGRIVLRNRHRLGNKPLPSE